MKQTKISEAHRAALVAAGWRRTAYSGKSPTDTNSETWQHKETGIKACFPPSGSTAAVLEFAALLGIAPKGYCIIPEETAADYLAARTAFFGQKVDGDPAATMENWTRYEDAEETLAIALGGARLLPPHQAGDDGLSPSPPRELSDDDLRTWSEITTSEPGFHQVNPINQRKAGAEPREEETP